MITWWESLLKRNFWQMKLLYFFWKKQQLYCPINVNNNNLPSNRKEAWTYSMLKTESFQMMFINYDIVFKSVCMMRWGGWVRRRCPVAFVTRVLNWYWLTVGQGLLSLQQLRVFGKCCYFFCSFTFCHFPLSSLFLSFISSIISSISFLPFSGRWHKMTHKGWRDLKPQHNQFALDINSLWLLFSLLSTITAVDHIIQRESVLQDSIATDKRG